MTVAIAITRVKVFDGNALTDERTVVIDHRVISEATAAERMVDGQHGTLLPGFIDSHVHLVNLAELEQGTQSVKFGECELNLAYVILECWLIFRYSLSLPKLS